MAKPLIIAHHLIWTGYGHWLPNDPRGSGSRGIGNERLAELGEVHYGRKKVQPSSATIREFYDKAEDILRYNRLNFDMPALNVIGEAFAQQIVEHKYTCYACAILPDHVHLLIRKHKHESEEMIANLQRASGDALRHRYLGGLDHPIWTNGDWHVFLFHPREVQGRIRYIEQNPIKEGLRAQRWPFVKVYDDWPLYPGHNPNSP